MTPELAPSSTRSGPHLRAFLAERDTPCPICGYNLRGLHTDRCPECSQRLGLRVNASASRDGWAWPASILGMSVAGGFGGLLLVAALMYRVVERGDWTSRWTGAVILGVFLVVVGGSGVVWLARASRWLGVASRPTRITLVSVSWGLVLGGLLTLSLMAG